MWPPQPGQACRAATSTRSRSGRGRADTLAIPRLQEIQPLQRSTPASFAGLEKNRKPGAGEGIRTLDPNLGKVSVAAFLRFSALLPASPQAPKCPQLGYI